MQTIFDTRTQAGRFLGQYLAERTELNDPVVLGLPRGGVVTGREVADALDAPLDVVVTKKIGAPMNPEYAIAAVDEDGRVVTMREDLPAGIPPDYVPESAHRVLTEVKRRARAYREGDQPIDLKGREVVIVDDGIATGLTVEAAVAYVRAHGAAKIVVAAPVSSPQAVVDLNRIADRVIVLLAPEGFRAVGFHYRKFGDVTDDEVLSALHGQPREMLHGIGS